jgi:hypothetical protein
VLMQPQHHVAPAVVYAPFGPVGYVLVDEHLLVPAIWDDPAGPPPTIGSLVAVNLPGGRLRPDLLPLVAFTPKPATAAEPEPGPAPELEEGAHQTQPRPPRRRTLQRRTRRKDLRKKKHRDL